MGKSRNSIIISGIIAAFILGSVSSVTLAEGSPASDAALIAALDGIRDAILGITPDITVNAPAGPPGPEGPEGPPGSGGGTATDLDCSGCVSEPELDFDPTTASELTSALTALGSHTVDTNAGTICGTGQLLDGDGNCIPIPVDQNTQLTESQVDFFVANNLLSGDISGTLSTTNIAANTVSGDEIAGTTKFVLGKCTDSFTSLASGDFVTLSCTNANISQGNEVIATLQNNAAGCFELLSANSFLGDFTFFIKNNCETAKSSTITAAYIVFEVG